MKTLNSFLAVAIALMLSVGCSTANDDIVQEANNWPSQSSYLLVDFRDDVSPQQVAVIEDELGIDVVPTSDMYSKTKLTRLKVNGNRYRLEEILDGLEDTGLVEALELEQTYTLIPGVTERGQGRYLGSIHEEWSDPFSSFRADSSPVNDPLYLEGKQWNMTMIGVEKAWETTQGKGVIVAVLDTGISTGKGKYPRVPDLRQTCMVEGRNFTRDGAQNDPYDFHGHGTHVGGTIAQSTNNGIGVVGVAHKACLMPVKVLGDRGSGSTAGIAEAIIWATDNGANVINMSLGGGGYSKVMDNALNYAVKHNVFVACACGNNGTPKIEYPAAMNGCQAVTSVGKSGNLAFYSSYGDNGDGVFIAAPGGDQRADGQEGGVWQNTIVTGDPNRHGYFPFQGTSMATPHVAGVAALVISELDEDYKLNQVKEAIASTARSKSDTSKYGNGLINAAGAVEVAGSIEAEDDEGLGALGWLLAIMVCLGAFRSTKFFLNRG